MRLRETPNLDYEPTVMYLSFVQNEPDNPDRIEQAIFEWMKDRGVECNCTDKLLLVQKDRRAPNRCRVMCQWLCHRCMGRLVSMLVDTFGSELNEIILGADE